MIHEKQKNVFATKPVWLEEAVDNGDGHEVEDSAIQEVKEESSRLNRLLDLNPAIFSDPTSLNSAECDSHSRPVTLSNPTAPDRPSSPAPPGILTINPVCKTQ